MNTNTNKKQDLSIDWSVEPHSRKWNGTLCFHPYKNYVTGARYTENTKAEYKKRLEEAFRKTKETKKANKTK